MALQTSGAISFSQIVAEFGGSGSHSLSEYHALAGKGVSGIPASGAISFSHFHGKSNQVTTSVWVSSGHNESTFQQLGYANPRTQGYWRWAKDIYYFSIWNLPGVTNVSYYRTNVSGSLRYYSHKIGTRLYQRGSYSHQIGSGTNVYWLRVSDYVTSWVDTSGYQNQTTTAQIST